MGVGATFGVELSASISVPVHDPIPEPPLPAATPGIPYTVPISDSDGSIDTATPIGFGTTYYDRIDPAGDDYLLTDLQSTNGTFVNNEKVVSHKLSHGDKIVIVEVDSPGAYFGQQVDELDR